MLYLAKRSKPGSTRKYCRKYTRQTAVLPCQLPTAQSTNLPGWVKPLHFFLPFLSHAGFFIDARTQASMHSKNAGSYFPAMAAAGF